MLKKIVTYPKIIGIGTYIKFFRDEMTIRL